VGNQSGYVNASQPVVYRGIDNDIHQLYTFNNGTQRAHADLSVSTGAPPAAGDPFGLPRDLAGRQLVDYKGMDGHIHQVWINSSDHWVHSDLTALAKAPLSAGDPFGYLGVTSHQIIAFRAVDNDIRQLYTSNGQWVQADVSAIVDATTAASSAYIFGDQIMDYRGADNHIHQLFLSNRKWVQPDLTNLAGAPLATGDPFGCAFSSQLAVYNGANGDIYQLYNNGTQWTYTDLSMQVGAPPSASDPFAYIFSNQDIVYRGTEGTFICCSCDAFKLCRSANRIPQIDKPKDKQLKHHMNKPSDPDKNTERVWETPTFDELPIAFEASSYALNDDDPPYR
jgi:hypothetical protein